MHNQNKLKIGDIHNKKTDTPEIPITGLDNKFCSNINGLNFSLHKKFFKVFIKIKLRA